MKLIESINMRPKNLTAFVLGASLFVIFLVLLALAAQGVFTSFDRATTLFLQANLSRSFDMPLSVFTLLGSSEVTTLAILASGYLLYRREKIVPYSFILFAVVLLFVFIGKTFLNHPTPPASFLRYDLPFDLPTSAIQWENSFPSGHVSRSIYVAVIIAFLAGRYLKKSFSQKLVWLLTLLFAIVVVVSRVYLGEHWVSDVIGGIFLGSGLGVLTLIYY